MSSTRLPGKVLLPLGDTTILGHTVRQVRKVKEISHVVVATSDAASDDVIQAYGDQNDIEIFRGSLYDVLDRYYRCAKKKNAEHLVRVTADCPVIDPDVISRVIKEYEKGEYDYVSTGRVISTFPDGMDTEIFSFSALERAWQEAGLASEREHVTPYIWNHPEIFRVKEIRHEEDLSAVRLTVDEPADYAVLQHIVAHVPDLHMSTILEYLLEHPDISAKNAGIVRDAGYIKSLKEDEKTQNE